MIKVGLVFSISNFFISRNSYSQGRKLSAKEIPSIYRPVARSEIPWWVKSAPLVEIGLTVWPKTGGGA